jgi:SulP family sulfate permease
MWMKPILVRLGMPDKAASMISRTGPLAAAIVFSIISYWLGLPDKGVATVGSIPASLPGLTFPPFDYGQWRALFLPAVFISIIGFVESVSVAKTFAAKRREAILPDNELVGLGAANLLAGLTGGMPVSGGFSRSVVNSDAGVQTPIASIMTGAGIALVLLFLTPYIAHVPQSVLAATIIVAVISLVDNAILRETWNYSKSDFTAALATLLLTLFEGVQLGVATGVVLSVLMYLYRTSRPHIAVIGLVPGTQHFRNVKRHAVLTSPHVLSVRVDESLYFANVSFLEEKLTDLLIANPAAGHLVLYCSAVNSIDASALDSLESLNRRLYDMGVTFHLAEVKGPIMDRLRRTSFLDQLTGQVFLSQFHAVTELDPKIVRRTETASPDPAEGEPAEPEAGS